MGPHLCQPGDVQEGLQKGTNYIKLHIWNAVDPRIAKLKEVLENSSGTKSYDANTEDHFEVQRG